MKIKLICFRTALSSLREESCKIPSHSWDPVIPTLEDLDYPKRIKLYRQDYINDLKEYIYENVVLKFFKKK